MALIHGSSHVKTLGLMHCPTLAVQLGEISLRKDIPETRIDAHLNSNRISLPILNGNMTAIGKLYGAEGKQVAVLIVGRLQQMKEAPRTRILDRQSEAGFEDQSGGSIGNWRPDKPHWNARLSGIVFDRMGIDVQFEWHLACSVEAHAVIKMRVV